MATGYDVGYEYSLEYSRNLELEAAAAAYKKAREARELALKSQLETFGIAGVTTGEDNLPRAKAYGTNLVSGNIVECWTSGVDTWGQHIVGGVVSRMEVLNMIVDYGEGPDGGIEAGQVFLDGKPFETLSNEPIQERIGTMDQTCMTGFEKKKKETKYDYPLLEADGWHTITSPHSNFDDLEFTLFFPNGLIKYSADGAPWEHSCHVQVEISVKDADDWTSLFDDDISAMTLQAFFQFYRVSDLGFNCVNGTQYDLRYKKTTADDVEGQTQDLELRSLREVIDKAFTRPGRALLGLRAVACSSLTSNDIQVVRKGRLIRTFNAAGEATIEYSDNRAWVEYDIETQPVIAGNGAGTPFYVERFERKCDDEMDFDFYYAWSLFCNEDIPDGYGGTEARCPCCINVSAFTDVSKLASAIALVGRAHLYKDGKISTGWIDDAVATATDLVTMDTIMENSWSSQWIKDDELDHTIVVDFNNCRKGGERDSASYTLEDVGSYQKTMTLDGVGLPTRGTAIHWAKYLMERSRLVLNENTFKVAKTGFRYGPGDVIRLQCKIANWGKAFRIQSSTFDTITVDRDAEAEVSPGDTIYIRTYDTVDEEVVTKLYIVDTVVLNYEG